MALVQRRAAKSFVRSATSIASFGVHKPSSVGATCSNSGVGSLQRKFRQIIQSDGANDLETLCANFVHRIIRSVPPGVIEIWMMSIVGIPIAFSGV